MPYKDPAKRREWRRTYDAENREQINARMRQYRQENPVRFASPAAAERERVRSRTYMQANGRAIRRKNRHGMRPEDWAQMWDEQQGRCYLCGDPLGSDGRRIHIEHDHTCCPHGKSCACCRRGLACEPCNHVIGNANDDPERLRRIADSLERTLAVVRPRIAAKAQQSELPFEAA